jgi:uroporphyrinogen-III synthase
MAAAGFEGMRVLALESRRAVEIAKLIRASGGKPVVAPAMREVPLESNQEALQFAARLFQGEFDLIIFLTGVGIRRLTEIVESQYDRARFIETLRRVQIASRGPKPNAALRELDVPITVTAPEPCTWHELVSAIDGAFGAKLRGMRAAVQEYGSSNPELLDALAERGVLCTPVPVYHWALPEDLEPLRNAVRSIIAGEIDVIVFLTAVQVIHLVQIADQMQRKDDLLQAMRRTVVLSIGPSTTEGPASIGIQPDYEPSHPKMGILIHEAAQRAGDLLQAKRTIKQIQLPSSPL